eukprot:SM000055S18253  [mRNA]  locus=s55:366823:367834:- [translate_table: standard]
MSGHGSGEDDAAEAAKWRNVTFAALAGCIGLTTYNLVGREEHEHHDQPAYSYLHMRNKAFPWGPNGLFEWNVKESHE